MAYIGEILQFAESKWAQKDIQVACDKWAVGKLYELGYINTNGLGHSINFKEQVFEDDIAAIQYLQNNAGKYMQNAVLVKSCIKMTPDKLKRRAEECLKEIRELDKPHYGHVKSKTVTCKSCNSVLNTTYCGKTWNNVCPVCKSDLRPATKLDMLNKYKREYARIFDAMSTGEMIAYYWLVLCEIDL